MERQTDSQYDDDLTVGIGDYDDESIDTGYVDLFEFSGDETSPIARLKTIVLSIDWEITDEVLTQFNEELLDLQDIWADDPVKLVYVQALQKISKYIFQQKSDSHPSAIKLLLTFYYNLEKIVLDTSLAEQEKKDILRSDVKKFEQLKRQIEAETAAAKKRSGEAAGVSSLTLSEQGAAPPVLFNLKACILGMDWEITERELSDLSKEIRRLEVEFAGNKPRMLFLQGIEALGGYIKLKRSNAHADAFKLLYSFYEGLEKIVLTEMSLDEEKAVLLPEVEKFEQFKKIIAPSLAVTPASDEEHLHPSEEQEVDAESPIAPAFADVPEEVHGFQAEQEAAALNGLPADVENRLDQFFTEPGAPEEPPPALGEDTFTREAADRVASFFDSEESRSAASYGTLSPEEALRGVDVETDADDDSDEEALPTQADGKLAPALVDTEEGLAAVEPDTPAQEPAAALGAETDLEERLDDFFDFTDDSDELPVPDAPAGITEEAGGPGEDDEGPLFTEESIAGLFGDAEFETESITQRASAEEDIDDRLDTLFADQDADVSPALTGLDVEDEQEIGGESARSAERETTASASASTDETTDLEERLASFFGEDEGEPAGLSPEDEDTGEIEDRVADFFAESDEAFGGTTRSEPGSDTDRMATDRFPAGEPAEMLFTEPEPDAAIPPEDQLLEGFISEELPDRGTDEPFTTFASESDEAEFFAAIDERVDEPGEFQMELLDETDDIETRSVAALGVTDEAASLSIDEQFEGGGDEQAVFGDRIDDDEPFVFHRDEDALADLRAGIASLGVEISDDIVQGILNAINGLRHRLAERPVEKTFLQLLSTIVQHIGQYRYEASAEAHGLLLSVFDKLELVQNPEMGVEQCQELLLTETTKVLLWQQNMLDRQVIRKGDQLTFLTPVRSDYSATDERSDAEVEHRVTAAAEEMLTLDDSAEMADDDEFSAAFEPVEEEAADADAPPAGEPASEEPAETTLQDDEPALFIDEDDVVVPGDESVSLDESFHATFEPVDEDIAAADAVAKEDADTVRFVEEADSLLSNDELAGLADELVMVDDVEPATPQEERLLAGEFDSVADFVKKELAALRQSLQEEIEDLRRRLEDKNE